MKLFRSTTTIPIATNSMKHSRLRCGLLLIPLVLVCVALSPTVQAQLPSPSPGGGTIKISGSTTNTRTFAGGGLTYPNFWFTNATAGGKVTISGVNTFSDFKCTDTNGQTLDLPSATLQTVSAFTVTGAAGNLITISSGGGATTAQLSAASGNMTGDYLNIVKCRVGGGAAWYAGTHSTDGGNNANWQFNSSMMRAF
jgi:hypothetical protein